MEAATQELGSAGLAIIAFQGPPPRKGEQAAFLLSDSITCHNPEIARRTTKHNREFVILIDVDDQALSFIRLAFALLTVGPAAGTPLPTYLHQVQV